MAPRGRRSTAPIKGPWGTEVRKLADVPSPLKLTIGGRGRAEAQWQRVLIVLFSFFFFSSFHIANNSLKDFYDIYEVAALKWKVSGRAGPKTGEGAGPLAGVGVRLSVLEAWLLPAGTAQLSAQPPCTAGLQWPRVRPFACPGAA